MNKQFSKQLQNLGAILNLPFESTAPTPKSDALDDVHIRFTELVNYLGEVLLTSHLAKKLAIPTEGTTQIKLKAKRNESVVAPNIAIEPDKWETLSHIIPLRLFFSSIVQLATLYEVFLSELIEDVLWRNDEWLELDEKQLTTREIFKFKDLKEVRQRLMDKRILDFAMLSYPKKVERFQRDFHVGLHHKSFPLTLFEVHDFLEVRNVIVHSDGHASDQYFERMSGYNQPTLLQLKYQTLNVDFSWLLTFGQRMMSLCNMIDEEIGKKWKTTRNSAT